jgi:tetratricopeptide (TPR) repeat protein
LGLAVLLIIYFAQNLLVFDMINTYLVFFLTLGFAGTIMGNSKISSEENQESKPINWPVAVVVFGLTGAALWWGNINPLMSNHYVINAYNEQNLTEAVSYFNKSLDTNMEKYEPREYFAQKMAKAAGQEVEDEATKEAFIESIALAETEMEQSVKDNPLDFRPHLFLGELYIQSYRFSGNKEKLIRADEILSEAIQLSPTNQQAYWNLADTRLMQGKISDTIALLQKAVDLEPRFGYSHWYLGMAYKIAGQYELAREQMVLAKEFGYNWLKSISDLNKVVEIYEALGDDAGLLPIFLDTLKDDPKNAELWASLAAVYANLGQYTNAGKAAQKVVEINPGLQSKVEQFLEMLPQ